MKRLGIISIILSAGFYGLGYAQTLKLEYGVNNVDINADGVEDIIVRTRWENMNAHSFDRYVIAMVLEGENYSGAKYYEVPLGDTYEYRIETREGAECVRIGYKFILNSDKMLEVEEYKLDESEEHYCGKAAMKTIKYRLMESEGNVGIPYFYLKKIEERKSLKKSETVEDLIY